MDIRGKMYLALLLIFLLISGVVAGYTLIKNHIRNKKADNRKVIFKNKGGKTKGFWRTKQGDKHDKNLKLED